MRTLSVTRQIEMAEEARMTLETLERQLRVLQCARLNSHEVSELLTEVEAAQDAADQMVKRLYQRLHEAIAEARGTV